MPFKACAVPRTNTLVSLLSRVLFLLFLWPEGLHFSFLNIIFNGYNLSAKGTDLQDYSRSWMSIKLSLAILRHYRRALGMCRLRATNGGDGAV